MSISASLQELFAAQVALVRTLQDEAHENATSYPMPAPDPSLALSYALSGLSDLVRAMKEIETLPSEEITEVS